VSWRGCPRALAGTPGRPEQRALVCGPALRSRWALVSFVVAGGASIEVAQLAISTVVGFRYRSIDVDDTIANAVGLALGWLAVVALITLRRSRRRRSR